MKTILLGIAIAVVLILTVPALRNSGGGTRRAPAAPPAPDSPAAESSPAAAPAPAPARAERRSGLLGQHGGLGAPTMAGNTAVGEAGAARIYTLGDLPSPPDLIGQVVRLRLSRPTFSAWLTNDRTAYIVSISDRDIGSGISVTFPAEAAEQMNLLSRTPAPGTSFYLTNDPLTGLRAVGREWRPDLGKYVW